MSLYFGKDEIGGFLEFIYTYPFLALILFWELPTDIKYINKGKAMVGWIIVLSSIPYILVSSIYIFDRFLKHIIRKHYK